MKNKTKQNKMKRNKHNKTDCNRFFFAGDGLLTAAKVPHDCDLMEAIYEETPEVVKAKKALTKMFNRK